MAGIGKFAPRTAAAPAAGARPTRTPPKPVSRYAGIKAGEDRDPMLGVGDYRVRIAELLEGVNPGKGNRMSTKVGMQIVTIYDEANTQHREGDVVKAVHLHTTAGLSELKRQVMQSAGYEVEEEFDAFEEGNEGALIDASLGRDNAFFQAGFTIVGRLVDVRVSKGNDTGSGDYYRKYSWAVVDEAEQDLVAKPEWEAAQ